MGGASLHTMVALRSPICRDRGKRGKSNKDKLRYWTHGATLGYARETLTSQRPVAEAGCRVLQSYNSQLAAATHVTVKRGIIGLSIERCMHATGKHSLPFPPSFAIRICLRAAANIDPVLAKNPMGSGLSQKSEPVRLLHQLT